MTTAGTSDSPDVPDLTARLVEFVGLLRDHGITAGPSDTVDAAAAMVALGLEDRDRLRAGLAATLLRRGGQRDVFDRLFDLYFSVSEELPEHSQGMQAASEQVQAMRDELVAQLAATDDPAALAELAARALTELGGYGRLDGVQGGTGSSATGGWSAYQALKQLRPEQLAERIAAAMTGRHAAEMDSSVAMIEADRRLRDFRTAVESEARRRTAALRGVERVARNVETSTDQVSFLSADERQLAEMRRLVQPLARKLATRLAARRRKASRGEIDFRRTARRSMATGGVPMKPVLKARRHGRPDLVVLADVSGSVAGFAGFTLHLVQALQDQFSRVRSFAFVDICDEITDLVKDGSVPEPDLAKRIVRHAGVARWGNSNYGYAFESFVHQYLDVVGPRTSLLILGDARANYGDPGLDCLRLMVSRARHAYWLNPEAAASWNTGDSIASRYAELATMYECRTVRQLADVVSRLLPA
jgi:uncharacterized protein